MISRRKQKASEKNLFQCRFGNCESYLKSPGFESGSQRLDTSV
jgi:hypothetical protein